MYIKTDPKVIHYIHNDTIITKERIFYQPKGMLYTYLLKEIYAKR